MRSMNSTWKIAFESACAGPSWISWASRTRSPSCASTIRIWSSVGSLGQGDVGDERRVPALDEQPGRLEVADGELEPGELGLVAAERRRSTRRRRPASAGAGRPRRPPRRPSRRHPRTPCEARSASAVASPPARSSPARSSVELLPAGHLVDVGLAIAVADPPERVRREAQGVGRLGVELVVAAAAGSPRVHPSRECIGRQREPRRRRARASTPAPAGRHARARDPEHAHALDGLGVRRVGGDRQQDLLEARGVGVRPVEDRGPLSVVGLGDDQPLARRSGSRGRGRPTGSRRAARGWARARSPRARSGSRGSRGRCRRAEPRWPPSARASTW